MTKKLAELGSVEQELVEENDYDFSETRVLSPATRSSKYSLTPLNSKKARTGRTMRVSGTGRRVARSGYDREERKPSVNDSSLIVEDRQVTISSGAMYPE